MLRRKRAATTIRLIQSFFFFIIATNLLGSKGEAASPSKPEVSTPPKVELRGASLAGTGCPAQQMAAASLDADKAGLAVTMPPFEASALPGKSSARKKCGALVILDHTPGWQLAITAAEFDLKGSVSSKEDGEVAYVHWFQGRADETAGMAKAIQGTLAAGHQKYEFPDLWSTCGSGVTIVPGIEARVPASEAKGNELAVSNALRLTLKWRPCKG